MTRGSAQYIEAVVSRRTRYDLSAQSPISDAALQRLVEDAVKHTPTAYNSQSGRAVLVLGDKHRQLWDIVYESHKKTLGGNVEREASLRRRIDSAFKSGYGTVVFFEDQTVINAFAAKFPDLGQLFPKWSDTSSGILQSIVWTALNAEGLGASLQHYTQASPETEAKVQSFLDVPPNWISTALLPFGTPTDPEPKPKTFEPIEDRVKIVA